MSNAATEAPALDFQQAEKFQQVRKTVVNPFLEAVQGLTVDGPALSVSVPSNDKNDATLKTYNRYLTEAGNKVGVTVRREVRSEGKGKTATHRLYFQAVPKIHRKGKDETPTPESA